MRKRLNVRAKAHASGCGPSRVNKRSITIPFIDFILSELKSRSENNRLPVSSILSLILAIAIDREPKTANFSIYQDDVPSFASLTSEIDQWTFYWRHKVASGEVAPPDNLIHCLPHADKDVFPNIRVLLPSHQCRGRMLIFSAAKAKNVHSKQHEEDRLASLSLMLMNYDIPIDKNEIVECFVRKNPSRLFRSLYIE